MRAEFDRLYASWRAKVDRAAYRSDSGWAWELPEYRAIVAMGPAVLPLMFREIEKTPEGGALWQAVSEITRVWWEIVFPAGPPGTPHPMSSSDAAQRALLEWWRQGRSRTAERFAQLEAKWATVRHGADEEIVLYSTQTRLLLADGVTVTSQPIPTPAGEVYSEMEKLGTPVLPLLMDRIEDGAVDLAPLVISITGGAARVDPGALGDMKLAQLRAWWEASKQDWLIPWPDEATAP